jgi:DNA mismatch repair ATPase MutS
MSGKSTLLRTIGINTVLAWAGAPVRAARLKISPLSLGVSIRVLDSLQDGRSRFYAEITRLREIIALTSGPRPVLFLLDELLSGTNSHDRQIGAAAIVGLSSARGALGLITTHDLALAHIADSFPRPRRQRSLRRHARKRRVAFRLPAAAWRGGAKQCSGSDALGRDRGVILTSPLRRLRPESNDPAPRAASPGPPAC